MCSSHDHIINSSKWNWDGDSIVLDPVIPKTRKVIGSDTQYDIDVREFMTSVDNAVVKRTLDKIKEKITLAEHRELFSARKEGAFDFKILVLKEYISDEIEYVDKNRAFDNWMFPDETITLKKGDCEDRAILLASLMLASGISSYNVRLCFGKISEIETGKTFDHVWVMYKNESGIWQLIEPASNSKRNKGKFTKQAKTLETGKAVAFDYTPYYLSNNVHMWEVRHSENEKKFADYISGRKFWSGYNPTFGYKTHKALVKEAIDSGDFFNRLSSEMKSELFTMNPLGREKEEYLDRFASMVSNVDITLSYNPLLHYDNAFIQESFDLMNKNLNDKKTLGSLSKAVHAIADLYSHSSYSEFAKKTNGEINVMLTPDPDSPQYAGQFINNSTPNYSTGIFDLVNFSTNSNLYKRPTKNAAKAFWNGKIISGRYGMSKDSQGLLERTQYWPGTLRESEMQGALPHHNEIAVDEETRSKEHKLYASGVYEDNFKLRTNAAKRHITKLFNSW